MLPLDLAVVGRLAPTWLYEYGMDSIDTRIDLEKGGLESENVGNDVAYVIRQSDIDKSMYMDWTVNPE